MIQVNKEFELLKTKYSMVELAQLCSLLTEYIDKNAMAKSTVDIIGDTIKRTINIDLKSSQLIDTINNLNKPKEFETLATFNAGSISRTRGVQ